MAKERLWLQKCCVDVSAADAFCSGMFSVAWMVWHLPLFFVAGAGQTTMDIGLYAIEIVGLSFSLGALRRINKSVFLY